MAQSSNAVLPTPGLPGRPARRCAVAPPPARRGPRARAAVRAAAQLGPRGRSPGTQLPGSRTGFRDSTADLEEGAYLTEAWYQRRGTDPIEERVMHDNDGPSRSSAGAGGSSACSPSCVRHRPRQLRAQRRRRDAANAPSSGAVMVDVTAASKPGVPLLHGKARQVRGADRRSRSGSSPSSRIHLGDRRLHPAVDRAAGTSWASVRLHRCRPRRSSPTCSLADALGDQAIWDR